MFTEPDFYRSALVTEVLDAANFIAVRPPLCI
jgi:hypothetical protein